MEFTANAQGWLSPQWAKITELNPAIKTQTTQWVTARLIDDGEAEAIGLALQEKADWLLTDDAQARQFAENLGLEVHGSIGVLLWNVSNGNIPDKALAQRLLENLAHSSLWVSERVLQKAKNTIENILA